MCATEHLSVHPSPSQAVPTTPSDLRDQHWLDDEIDAIEGGIEAVLDIARNWSDLRNLSRLHPGVSAQDYILARVQHPLGRGVVVPLLEGSNWSQAQIAAIAGVSTATVSRTVADVTVDRPAETLGADGKLRPGRVVREVVAQVIEPADEPGLGAVEPLVEPVTVPPMTPLVMPLRIILRDFARRITDIRVDDLTAEGWSAIDSIEMAFATLRSARDDHAGHVGLEDFVTGCAACDAAAETAEAEEEARYRAEAKAERQRGREQAKRRAAWILADPDAIAWRCDGCETEFTDEDADQGQGPLYECRGDCGTQFTQDGSADGDGNRCLDCNKFGGKIADLACPDCGAGGLEPLDPEAGS